MSTQKLFSPHEATQTLPLVKRIVEDILQRGKELRRLHESGASGDDKQQQCSALESSLHDFLAELEELGCSFKDWNFELGLVDFPSHIEGEPVLLCWRSAESDLRYYHGLHDGYAGRKPIPESLLQTPGPEPDPVVPPGDVRTKRIGAGD